MQAAPLHPEESARLEDLLNYELLDTEAEQSLDELTQLASDICQAPISLISLVDESRQWFKSKVGLDADETDREVAFCSHAILQDEVFEVCNALDDERFFDNPLVTSDPSIRFYAGAPLVTKRGLPLGTLCVIDSKPRKLNESQLRALKTLSRQVVRQLELRLYNRQLQRMSKESERFYAILAHDLRSPFNAVLGLSRVLKDSAENLSPDKVKQISEQILGSSLNLFQLLDEILQWSQNRLGASGCKLSELNILEAAKSACEVLNDAAELKAVALDYQVDTDARCMADETITKAVIRNLIANAIKYSPEHSSIRISAFQEGAHTVVRVEDDGPGIPDSVAEKLFVECVDSQASTEGQLGTGIGLRLCYDFMQMQKGQLRLDRNYKQGAALELLLPSLSP